MSWSARLAAAVLALCLAAVAGAEHGTVWQTSATLTDQNTPYGAVLLSDQQLISFNRDTADGASLTLRQFQSVDAGATFQQTLSIATGLASALPSPVSALYLPASGNYVLAGQTTLGAGNVLVRGSSFSWAFPTVTGGPAGTITGHSLGSQGSTLLVLVDPGSGGNVYTCRSTDQGVTWACQQPGIGPVRPLLASAAAPGTLQGLASARLNHWLVLDDTATVWRSLNDGLTWTSITQLSTDATPLHGVVCATSSICLAVASSPAATRVRFFRSVNGGTTWSAAGVVNRTDRIATVLNLGQGVVAAMGDPTAAPPAPSGYRSTDFGLSWTPVPGAQLAAPVTGATFVAYLAAWAQTDAAGAYAYHCTGGGTCGILPVRSPHVLPSGARVVNPVADVTVTGAATLVRPQNYARALITCTNNDPAVAMRLGDAAVTATRGVRLRAGGSVMIAGVYAVYAVSEGANVTLSCTEDLR